MRILVSSMLLAALSTADAAPKCDLSTDAGVDAAYKAATGKEMSTYGGRCAQRSTTFPNMYVLGSFASDYGCMWEGTLHGCTWNDPKAAKIEMAAAGWAKADAKRKGELAIAWLREVDQINLEDPHAAMVGGSIVVDYTLVGHVGMNPAPPSRDHMKITFAADGSHGAAVAQP